MKIETRLLGTLAALAALASVVSAQRGQKHFLLGDPMLTRKASSLYHAMTPRSGRISERLLHDLNACHTVRMSPHAPVRPAPTGNRNLFPVDPVTRARLKAEEGANTKALKYIYDGSQSEAPRRLRILKVLDGHLVSKGQAADFLMDLCRTDIALGLYSEALQALEVGGPQAGRAIEPEDDIPLIFLALLKENGLAWPQGAESYLERKFEAPSEFPRGPVAHRLFKRGPERQSRMEFQAFLLLAESRDPDPAVMTYAARRALQIQPWNALAIIDYSLHVRPDDPSVVPRALSIVDRLPEGRVKDELSAILSPGTTRRQRGVSPHKP